MLSGIESAIEITSMIIRYRGKFSDSHSLEMTTTCSMPLNMHVKSTAEDDIIIGVLTLDNER